MLSDLRYKILSTARHLLRLFVVKYYELMCSALSLIMGFSTHWKSVHLMSLNLKIELHTITVSAGKRCGWVVW